MVADMEVDKVADMVADIDINIEIQFGERVGHGGWLIGPKLFRPKPLYPACASSKLCDFILHRIKVCPDFLWLAQNMGHNQFKTCSKHHLVG